MEQVARQIVPDPDAGWTLPAWTYTDRDFFDAEVARVFRPSWQVVCHVSDIPHHGDFHTLDYIGESVVVVRGKDARLRAFTNVCRHRGARIVDVPSGCARRLVCPYHAWTYDLEGKLTVMVANLAPRKMKFGLSEGMVLAASHGNEKSQPGIYILTPWPGAQPGMRIH